MKAFTIPQPLYQQAYELIKDLIISGQISPGSRIVITKLAEKYNISRTPFREALRQLEKDGLLESDNLGSKVVELDSDDFDELYECRILLEADVIKNATKNIRSDQLTELQEILNKVGELLEGPPDDHQQIEILKLNTKFHESLANASTNKRLTQLLDQVRNLLLLYRANILKIPEHNAAIYQEHKTIFNAVKAGEHEKAMEVVIAHLKNDRLRGIKVFAELKKETREVR